MLLIFEKTLFKIPLFPCTPRFPHSTITSIYSLPLPLLWLAPARLALHTHLICLHQSTSECRSDLSILPDISPPIRNHFPFDSHNLSILCSYTTVNWENACVATGYLACHSGCQPLLSTANSRRSLDHVRPLLFHDPINSLLRWVILPAFNPSTSSKSLFRLHTVSHRLTAYRHCTTSWQRKGTEHEDWRGLACFCFFYHHSCPKCCRLNATKSAPSLLLYLSFSTSQELAGISFRVSYFSKAEVTLFCFRCSETLHFAHYLRFSSLSFKEMGARGWPLASPMPPLHLYPPFLPDLFPASRIFQSFNRPINLPSHYHSYQLGMVQAGREGKREGRWRVKCTMQSPACQSLLAVYGWQYGVQAGKTE